MIIGAHTIVYSTNADADRKFLRDVLGLSHVDVGDGWLVFGLPPSEVAVHPSDLNDVHEFYLMCADVEEFIVAVGRQGVACSPVQDLGWGRLTQLTLPGGGKLGVYEPLHARPKTPRVSGTAAKPSRPRASANASRKKAAASRARVSKAAPRKAGRAAKAPKAKARNVGVGTSRARGRKGS